MLSLNPCIDDGKEMDPRQSLYLNGRPVWGPHLYDFVSCGEMRAAFLETLEAMREIGGAVLVPFAGQAERSLMIFLNIVAGGLIHQGVRVHFTQFLDVPALFPPPQSCSVWLIYQADAFPDLQMILEKWLQTGRAAILAGFPSSLSPSLFNAPAKLFEGFEVSSPDFDRLETEALAFAQNTLASLHTRQKQIVSMSDIHRQVALCDAWGVSVPLELLARCLKMEEDELAPLVEELYREGEDGILYWLAREKPPALMVATRSESYARRFVMLLSGEQGLTMNDYRTLVESVDAERVSERYTLLQLFLGMTARARFRRQLGENNFNIESLREFILVCWKKVQSVAAAGSSAEHLLWGLCLLRLGLFEQGRSVLSQGVIKDKTNIYLHQALARLLALWSRMDDGKVGEAEAAFQRASALDKNNVYVWQAWGVFSSEKANWQRAEYCFQKALAVSARNVFVLAARANMHLDMGQIEKADADLAAAAVVADDNLHVMHLLGRLAFWRGEWAQAERYWRDMLHQDKNNSYASQSLAYMARQRGNWGASAFYLNSVLENDPENEACLLEAGLLRQDKAMFMAEGETRRCSLEEALMYFERALGVAPWNPKVIVALSVAERLLGKVDAAADRLVKLLNLLPDNDYAGYALALCEQARGNETAMLRHLRVIYERRRGHNLTVLFALIEIMIKKGQTEDARRELLDIIRHKLSDLAALKQIEARLEAARLFAALDEKKDAGRALNEADRIDPENQRISWCRENLAI